MADYSEFPTTPTGWQERQAQDWETVTPLDTEDAAPPPRRVDLGALVPGVVFIVLAIVLMTGVDLPLGLWRDGGLRLGRCSSEPASPCCSPNSARPAAGGRHRTPGRGDGPGSNRSPGPSRRGRIRAPGGAS